MNIFKKYKTVLISTASLLLVLYAAFLFVLPNVININNYKKDIQKLVYDNVKLNFDFENIKIVTTPTLKAGVNVKGVKLAYPSGKDILTLKEAEAKISLLPLFLKTVKVADVYADTPVISLQMQKDGQLDIVDYVTKNLPQQEQVQTQEIQPAELPVKISDNLPDVVVKNYALALKSEKTNNTISVKGDEFVLDKAVLNKQFRVASKGKIFLNNNENIIYNARLMSFWPAITTDNQAEQSKDIPQIDFINEIVKFNPKADVNCDITLKEHQGHTDIYGFLNAEKLSVKLDGTTLPDSYFKLQSTGHKTQIDSNLFISPSEKAQILANIAHGLRTQIELNVKTEKLTFAGIQNFAKSLLNSFNIKNDIASLNTKGVINADFTLKTDLKHFESSGYFKVIDGAITHKTIPAVINAINANIDFSNNQLNIKNTTANINGAKISAMGTIDSKANADITVKSDNINLAPLFKAFAPSDLKKMYALNSGVFNVNVKAQGKLDKIQPSVEAFLRNFVLKTKYPMPVVTIKSQDIKVNVTPEKLVIVPFNLLVNSSKINVSGGAENLLNDMNINILANGSVAANDLKNLLPKEARPFIGAKGAIPLKAYIKGNDKKIDIAAQAYPSSVAHFSPVTVKKMAGANGLVNFSASFANDKLIIEDAGLYMPSKALSSDFAANKKGSQKIAAATGSITDLSSSHPILRLNFSIPENLLLSNVSMPNASLKARGDLNISGDINRFENMSYKGFLSVNDVNVPELLVKLQNADVEFNGSDIAAKINKLDLNGTTMNIDADASTRFTNVFNIKRMVLSSANFDVDKIFKVMDKVNAMLPPAAPAGSSSGGNSTALVMPVKISNGTLNIQKFVMKQIGGNLEANDVSGDFTLVNDLFKLNNLKATVWDGSVNGNVTYNLKTTAVTAKITGNKINANPAVTTFVGLKDQIMGNIDFNADIKLKGATYQQQMKSLNGKVTFSLKDGQMGSLGRFETFLKADNLLTQSFIATKVGSIISAIAPFNTGKFAYLTGDVNIYNGVASLDTVRISGPHMSLLLTGNVNVLSMMSNIQILGSLSPEVTKALGPIADLSVCKIVSYLSSFGSKVINVFGNFNLAMKQAELNKIPALTPAKSNTKSFKVVLCGNLNNPATAIKKFQWLNTPEKIQEEQAAIKDATAVKTPVTKEEIKENLKEGVKQGVTNAIQNNETLQKNKTVKSITDIYNFYKNAGTAKTE